MIRSDILNVNCNRYNEIIISIERIFQMKKAQMIFDKHFVLSKVDERIYGSFVEHLGCCVYEGIYQQDSEYSNEKGIRQDVSKLFQQLMCQL